jgi:hypothetical protein
LPVLVGALPIRHAAGRGVAGAASGLTGLDVTASLISSTVSGLTGRGEKARAGVSAWAPIVRSPAITAPPAGLDGRAGWLSWRSGAGADSGGLSNETRRGPLTVLSMCTPICVRDHGGGVNAPSARPCRRRLLQKYLRSSISAGRNAKLRAQTRNRCRRRRARFASGDRCSDAATIGVRAPPALR